VRLDDRFVDIVAEGLDAGIRLSEAIDRDMVQLRLSPGGFVVAGAPAYLERGGEPKPAQAESSSRSGLRLGWARP
jgi:DNA-binding transcriptional LysR family regulator